MCMFGFDVYFTWPFYWQLIVRLSDGAGRVAAQSATVTVVVIRNENTPFFINEPYSRLIQENLPTGTSIYQVTARDNDAAVSTVKFTWGWE